MAEIQAHCLYDFDGDHDSGELSFYGGDVLTIIRQDIGDGWWEARNASGEQGLIPETYVEVMSAPEPTFPPPPPPMVPSAPSTNGYTNGPQDSGGGMFSSGDLNMQPQPSYEEWDDEWDDDDESSNSTVGTSGGQSHQEPPSPQTQEQPEMKSDASQSHQEPPSPQTQEKTEMKSDASQSHQEPPSPQTQEQPEMKSDASQDLHGQGNFGLAAPRREGKQLSPTGEMSKYGTVRSSFSRFSTFAKTGGEAFLMAQEDVHVPESDQIKIIEMVDGPVWYNQDTPYTCCVASPKKESKMKGLKSYIAYQLTPTFSNIQVSRRYKHFDWLHKQLELKYSCVPIPPLPDKQVTGRYEEDFVLERMKFLQMWVDRLVRHPVISRSEVFLHFLTCTDERKWKQGKRKSEKDDYQGGKFFLTVSPPQQALDMRDVDAKMETFQKFVLNMNENTKQLNAIMHDYSKKQTGPFKREYTKIGTAFKQLAMTFNLDTNEASRQLTAAIDHTGDAFIDIGVAFEKQPTVDTYPLMDSLLEYRGILNVYPDVLKVHEGAIGKAKECMKQQEEGKMSEGEVQKVLHKADTISYASLAEMNHFQRERVKDFKVMMQQYLRSQIQFYQDMTQKLEVALGHYDNVQSPS